MSRRNLSVLLVGLVVGLLCVVRAERNPYARFTSRAYRLIDDVALETPPSEELFAGAVRGMVSVLRERGDVHSGFLEPGPAESFRAEMRQEFGGVGVSVGVEGDPPQVTIVDTPFPGTPAYDSPIQARDVIVAVDGVSVVGLDLGAVVGRMRGPVGEPLQLTVRHASGREETFRLVREVIQIPSVIGDRRTPDGDWLFRLQADRRVALVRLTNFGNRTGEEFAETLAGLTNEGVEAIVLDLRGNPGGAVDAALAVCEPLLPRGAAITSTRGRRGEVLSSHASESDGAFEDLPLAVLIDGYSASASEIVAAALQDHGRVVVGQRSFGKGTVQQLLPLEAGRSELRLTAATYWRPSGVNIHRLPNTPHDEPWGVQPSPGYEAAQTEEEIAEWYAWRRKRDLAINRAGSVDDSLGPLEADRPLALALEALQAPLHAAR